MPIPTIYESENKSLISRFYCTKTIAFITNNVMQQQFKHYFTLLFLGKISTSVSKADSSNNLNGIKESSFLSSILMEHSSIVSLYPKTNLSFIHLSCLL